MQSTALTISPSSPLLKFPRQCNPSFRHGLIPNRLSCSSSPQNNLKNSVNEFGSSFWSARSWSFASPSFSSSKLSPWNSGKSPFVVAASAPESAEEDRGLKKTHRLGMLMSLWYLFNTYFNIFNKQVSYMILQRISPVTHSVGNFVKRVALILSSIIFFQTPVSPPINSSAGQVEDIEIHEKDLESEDNLLDLYERWRSRYGVRRGPEEMKERFKAFKETVEYIYRANQYLSYELGLNPFSDMTHEEFKKKFGLRAYTDKELEVMRKCQD